MNSPAQPGLARAIWHFWADRARGAGPVTATAALLATVWEFIRDSAPERLRQRFGDADYDWDFRVNTTGGALSWQDRLLGALHSPYQPSEPVLFHEMLDRLAQSTQMDWREFTFLDLGSGKGRALLMASDYAFHRIVGVELLPALHRIALENLRSYKSERQRCSHLEAICADAASFPLPNEPLVIYLFNPLPEAGLRRFLANLDQSLRARPRPAYLVYHNPLLEPVVTESPIYRKIAGTHQYSIFRGEVP
jgi:SAM-dependent methyltransferase